MAKSMCLELFNSKESDVIRLDVDWYEYGDILSYYYGGDMYSIVILGDVKVDGNSFTFPCKSLTNLVVQNGIWKINDTPVIQVGEFLHHVYKDKNYER
jgi:hypothetical protein